jgi:XisH protein
MAKDKFHMHVRVALENDGWTITHDPYKIVIGRRKGYIDLGAELIGAEKATEKIAVEIKSFLGLSDLDQFEDALGQFLIYLFALNKREPERMLFLAIPNLFYESFFDDPFFVELAQHYALKIAVFDQIQPLILKWIK